MYDKNEVRLFLSKCKCKNKEKIIQPSDTFPFDVKTTRIVLNVFNLTKW